MTTSLWEQVLCEVADFHSMNSKLLPHQICTRVFIIHNLFITKFDSINSLRNRHGGGGCVSVCIPQINCLTCKVYSKQSQHFWSNIISDWILKFAEHQIALLKLVKSRRRVIYVRPIVHWKRSRGTLNWALTKHLRSSQALNRAQDSKVYSVTSQQWSLIL